MNAAGVAQAYIAGLVAALQSIPPETIGRIASLLERARNERRMILMLGNGGSAATASHFVVDLNKTANRPGAPRLRAMALTDNVPLLTAWANDARYQDVFVEQIENFVHPGDVVIAISGSGQSPNVLAAVRRAREIGATTVGLTGFDGGQLKDLVDICLIVRGQTMGQVEDAHLAVGHMLAAVLAGRAASAV
jgi:D-sedoheptulose 7-phosphate isomerase